MENISFQTMEPSILYVGTPVVLITTIDGNGNANIGPISSAWATGRTFFLGLLTDSKTFHNLIEQKECVLNYPDSTLYGQVERIARLTGMDQVPEMKKDHYSFSADKFCAGNFSRIVSEAVKPPRRTECPVQLEAIFKKVLYIEDDPVLSIPTAAAAVRVVKIHVRKDMIAGGRHIDPAKWDPLIYNFRHYFGLGKDLGKTFKAEV